MSTNWIPQHPVSFDKCAAFDRDGILAQTVDGGQGLVLTDGQNYLHVYPMPEQGTVLLERSGANDPVRILKAIEDTFGIKLVSEYDPDYEGMAEQIIKS